MLEYCLITLESLALLLGKPGETTYRLWLEGGATVDKVAEKVGDAVGVESGENIKLMMQTLQDMWHDFVSHLPVLIVGLVILLLTWLVSRLVDFAAKKALYNKRVRRSVADLIRQVLTVVIWVFGIVVTAVVIFPGMTPSKVLTGLGIGSVALGFAFKDIVENFLAGVLILWKFPFDPGDFIELDGITGMVEEVTIRMTLIRRMDGELVVVPNAKLFKEPVNVLTASQLRRVTVICGVAYKEDVDASRAVIEDAVKACNSVADKMPVEVFAQEFADSSVNFEVTWWCGSTPLQVRQSRDEVIACVKRALDDAGIEIPFPYRTLTFDQALPVEKRGG